MWRIFASEDLRANSTPDLAVAIDEADRESGARSSGGGLNSPWPIITL
jgi:hypothetical protein